MKRTNLAEQIATNEALVQRLFINFLTMNELSQVNEHLRSLSASDWAKLFDLLPEMEQQEDFGQMREMEKLKNGGLNMAYWVKSGIIDKFLKTVYELGIVINFDWMSWEEGKELLRNKSQDFDKLEAITLCKLITLIVRSDRFVEGSLVGRFEDGTIQKIVNSLKTNLSLTAVEIPMEYIPKVGDQIYIDSAFYVTHGEDDFIGGLCTITYVEGDKPPFWIRIAEDRGTFTWKYIREEQERLKKEFGSSRGYRRPDDREEFNRL